jgi:small subunit ribosomal protein S2
MEKVLGGIAQMGRTPAALFMVDISHEHIALAEAKRLGITTLAMVDTNSDPTKVDFAVPANDDATKSIAIVVNYLTAAIMEGLQERATAKESGEEEGAGAEEAADDNATRMQGGDEEGGDGKERGDRQRRGVGAGVGRSRTGGAPGGAGRPRTGTGGGSRPGGAPGGRR